MIKDIEYYSRRVAVELDLAEQSSDPAVASIHRQMAMTYAERVATMRTGTEDTPMPPADRDQPSTNLR